MHELGIVSEIVKMLDELKEEHSLTQIAAVTLDIGEFSDVLPDYLTECFNVLRRDTYLKDTKMKINVIPAAGKCNLCGNEFYITENGRRCPKCKNSDFAIISGREFIVKEIEAL